MDYGSPCEVCELCGKDQLRYHFEIHNDYTKNTLDVGSHCILRFELPVYENGRRLSQDEAKKLLDKLTKKMRLESCIKSLEDLAKSERNAILENALTHYRKNKKLTPKQAFVVFWRLRENGIDHLPSFFSIDLKKKRYVDDLQSMATRRVHFFWLALTSAQRKKAIELGHMPPAEQS